MNEVMLFPLTSVVLPRGVMHLRIFEPRYQRLVRESCLNNTGFGVCMAEGSSDVQGAGKMSSIGTLVTIVDFETLEDGLLGITVTGQQRFSLKRVWVEADGLRRAEVEWLPDWPLTQSVPGHKSLVDELARVYEQIPQIGRLYTQRHFDDPGWVAQRWLELLPLGCELFEQLAGAQDCLPALRFLTDAIDAG